MHSTEGELGGLRVHKLSKDGPLDSGPAVSYYVGTLGTHTEIKRVAEERVTLPCHHQLGLPEKDTLDIEWLLTDNEGNQKVVITYSSHHVYSNLTEEQKGRVAFASNFLAGDASLQIEPLKPSDEGRYTCKVKNSGRYVWSHVTLKVLDVQSIGMIAGAVTGMVAGALLTFLLVWLLIRRKDKERYEEEERPNEIREDAEAPKARLVKPSSSSSGSRSSRSGSSSTRSTANSASRSQRTLSTEAAPQPGLATHAYSLVGPAGRGSEPKKVHHATLTKAEPHPA
uniref:Ig-like domain-containing protein n=1 Tax=Felis catus TaxID=9685 RepID=A0ABI7ZC55_FELCA